MILNFPNPSRSFDAPRARVRFWAYDRTMEVSLFIAIDALRKLVPEMGDEEDHILKVFDTARERINDTASRVYARTRTGTYTCSLAVEDF